MKSIELLKNINEMKEKGIWLSGIEGEGEFRKWYSNGQQLEISNWKDGKKYGEYKYWYHDGRLLYHLIYENSIIIEDLLK